MAFFEKKNTPQMAIQNQINDKLNFINQRYMDIGRYVKLNMADKVENEEIKSHISSIDSALNDLKVLNDQLNALNGLKTCANCGNPIPINNSFCPNCGAKQPQQTAAPAAAPVVQMPNNTAAQQPVQMPQPQVYAQQPVQQSQPVQPQPVAANQTAVQPQTQTADVQTEQPKAVITQSSEFEKSAETVKPQKFVFCSQCGNKEESGVQFCSQCGSKL